MRNNNLLKPQITQIYTEAQDAGSKVVAYSLCTLWQKVIFVSLFFILFSGCNGGAFWFFGDKYVARVNDDIITEYDFKKRLEGFHTVKDIKEKMKIDIDSVDYYKILNDMIDDKLIVQEAIKIGLDKIPEFAGDYKLYSLNLSLYMLKKEEVIGRIKITDEEIKSRYITLYESVRLRHFFTKDRKKGESIIDAVKKNADFSNLVEEESEDSDEIKKKKGDVGFKRRGELPKEIADAAFAMKEGEISGLINTVHGFHIIKLEEKRAPDEKISDKERKRIERAIFNEKEIERSREYLSQLREKAKISINEDILKGIKRDEEFDGGKGIVAIVDGETIKRDEVLVRLRSEPEARDGDDLDRFKKSAIDSLINQRLLDKEVGRRNYEKNEDFRYSLLLAKESILNKIFKNKIIAASIKLDDEEIRKYYDDNKGLFKEPEKVRMSTIIIKEKKDAERIVDELKKGADFDATAADISMTSVISKGEDSGWLYADMLPTDIKEKLNEMEIGGIYGPFNFDRDFIVIKFIGREEGKLKSFESVRGGIIESLSKKKYEQLISDYLMKLRAVSKIRINEPAMKGHIKPKRGMVEQRPE